MKIVIAPDSFKGNLTATEVARAITRGIRRVLPDAQCSIVPMADGGEGTVDAIIKATGGRLLTKIVLGPLGKPTKARYGLFDKGRRAIIEMAASSGLPLVAEKQRNPLRTTTFGTGELIHDAMRRGARHLMIGIGGSATVDGGVGMAQALGVRFLDKRSRLIQQHGAGGMLHRIEKIDISQLDPLVGRSKIWIASDVKNTLCGTNGAAQVYGPQKGATPKMVEILDNNLRHLARLIKRDLGISVVRAEGAGAAGGLGAGLMAFLRAVPRSGVQLVMEAVGLEEKIRKADLVITGEGLIDRQTPFGKTPSGVAQLAQRHGVAVIAIGGGLADDANQIFAAGIDGLASAVARDMSLAEAMRRARLDLANTAERTLRLVEIGRRLR